MSNELIVDDSPNYDPAKHIVNRHYQRINQPTNRDPSRLQVAMYFDGAADNALDELETWAKMWGSYYDPAILKAALVALRAVKETVNR